MATIFQSKNGTTNHPTTGSDAIVEALDRQIYAETIGYHIAARQCTGKLMPKFEDQLLSNPYAIETISPAINSACLERQHFHLYMVDRLGSDVVDAAQDLNSAGLVKPSQLDFDRDAQIAMYEFEQAVAASGELQRRDLEHADQREVENLMRKMEVEVARLMLKELKEAGSVNLLKIRAFLKDLSRFNKPLSSKPDNDGVNHLKGIISNAREKSEKLFGATWTIRLPFTKTKDQI